MPRAVRQVEITERPALPMTAPAEEEETDPAMERLAVSSTVGSS